MAANRRQAERAVEEGGRYRFRLRKWATGGELRLAHPDVWRTEAERRGHLTAEGTVTLRGWDALLDRRERGWLDGRRLEGAAMGGSPEREIPRTELLALARMGLCAQAGKGRWALLPLGELLVDGWRRQAARAALGWDV